MSPFVVAPQTKNVPAEEPERARSNGHAQCIEGGTERRRSGDRGRLPTLVGAEGAQTHVLRTIAHEQEDCGQDERERDDRNRDRGVAPVEAGDPRQPRQEHELPRRVARRHQPGHETASVDEPAVGDDRRERHGDGAGREPVDDAPEQEELPRLRHPGRRERRQGDRAERNRDDAPDAEALDQRRRKRRSETEAEQVERDGETDRLVAPAELLVQRDQQHPGRRPEARRHHQREEPRRGDDPGVVDARGHRSSNAAPGGTLPLTPSRRRRSGRSPGR